jgi:hypothetical protein
VATRIFLTAIALLLALGGFAGIAPTEGGPLDPIGIFFLFLSGVVWLGWDALRESYFFARGIGRDDIDPMMVRSGPLNLLRPRLPPFITTRRSAASDRASQGRDTSDRSGS